MEGNVALKEGYVVGEVSYLPILLTLQNVCVLVPIVLDRVGTNADKASGFRV